MDNKLFPKLDHPVNFFEISTASLDVSISPLLIGIRAFDDLVVILRKKVFWDFQLWDVSLAALVLWGGEFENFESLRVRVIPPLIPDL